MAKRIGVKKTYKLYIGGTFPRSESGRTLPEQAADGTWMAHMARASRKDLRNAVVAARAAQRGWAGRSAFNRGQILYRLAEMLETRRASLEARIVELGLGKGKAATADLDEAIDLTVWYAGWADKYSQLFSTVNPVATPYFAFTTPEPTGVIGVLAPEGTLAGLLAAILPVITSGNSCVVLTSGVGATLGVELAEALATSDLPGGVVNILTGLRDELLSWFGSHVDIDGVVAYGLSTDERTELETLAADSVKRIKVHDGDPKSWNAEPYASPWRIADFVEMKSAWHPIGG